MRARKTNQGKAMVPFTHVVEVSHQMQNKGAQRVCSYLPCYTEKGNYEECANELWNHQFFVMQIVRANTARLEEVNDTIQTDADSIP